MTERLIEDPFPYKPSDELLERLREIDPRLEVLNMIHGKWVVGIVQPSSVARRRAIAALDGQRAEFGGIPRMGTLVYFLMAIRGFRPWLPDCRFPLHMSIGGIVNAVRRADWMFRHQAEAAFEERLRASDDETRLQKKLKAVEENVKGSADAGGTPASAYKYAMKRRSGKGRPTVVQKERAPWVSAPKS